MIMTKKGQRKKKSHEASEMESNDYRSKRHSMILTGGVRRNNNEELDAVPWLNNMSQSPHQCGLRNLPRSFNSNNHHFPRHHLLPTLLHHHLHLHLPRTRSFIRANSWSHRTHFSLPPPLHLLSTVAEHPPITRLFSCNEKRKGDDGKQDAPFFF